MDRQIPSLLELIFRIKLAKIAKRGRFIKPLGDALREFIGHVWT